MARRARPRTKRRWRVVVGLVGPEDVKALQVKVHDYQASLQASVDSYATSAGGLPIDGTQWSVQRWADLVGRCTQYGDRSTNAASPFAYLYAGSAYDEGRALIGELDSWRDHLAGLNAPKVPGPMPVPHSDVGLAGGLGFGLAAIVAILALRELR